MRSQIRCRLARILRNHSTLAEVLLGNQLKIQSSQPAPMPRVIVVNRPSELTFKAAVADSAHSGPEPMFCVGRITSPRAGQVS